MLGVPRMRELLGGSSATARLRRAQARAFDAPEGDCRTG